MAGSNGTPDFVESNREDEILNLKYRGIIYHNSNPVTTLSTAASITGAQLLNDLSFNGTTPNAIAGPTGAALSTFLAQRYLTTLGSQWQQQITNLDPTNAKVITLPAPAGAAGGYINADGTSPATITIPPNSTAIVGYQVTQQSPLIVKVLYTLVSTSPGIASFLGFGAVRTTNQATAINAVVVFDNTTTPFNFPGLSYDNTTGLWTVRQTGPYNISAFGAVTVAVAASDVGIFCVSGPDAGNYVAITDGLPVSVTPEQFALVRTPAYLQAGDVLEVQLLPGAGATITLQGAVAPNFLNGFSASYAGN